MSIRAQTIRRMSLSQPGGPTPDAVPAVERTGVVASAVGGREDRTGQMIGKSLSALSEFAQRVDARKDEIEITRYTTQLEVETAGLAQQVRSEAEPNQVPQQYWEQHKAVTERVLEQTDDPDVRLAIGQAATQQRAQNFSQIGRAHV